MFRIIKFILDQGYPVTLALDGWTNSAHNKVTNLLLLSGGRSFYWKSVVNSLEHNTAGIFYTYRLFSDNAHIYLFNNLFTISFSYSFIYSINFCAFFFLL